MRIVDPPAEVRQHVDQAALKEEAERAHRAVQQADHDAALKKKEAGEILVKLKKDVGPGKWKRWCAENLSFHYRTARRYMRIAENWPSIEAKVTALSPASKYEDLSYLSGGAALRIISEARRKRGKTKLPDIPEELTQYEQAIKRLNKEFGIKAPPAAVLGLMLKLGIPEATLKKTLKTSLEEQVAAGDEAAGAEEEAEKAAKGSRAGRTRKATR